MAHSPEAIANEFLRRARDKGVTLTPMQLQKLVYIAHGWGLALLDRALVADPPQAWDWGPVYPTLYRKTREFGSGPVFDEIDEYDIPALAALRGVVSPKLGKNEAELIDGVFGAYGDLHAFQLSALTHNPGTPWTEIYNASGRNSSIPNDLIKKHFASLAAEDAA